jgi:drug/metabolite transporter (DMT)-like permease
VQFYLLGAVNKSGNYFFAYLALTTVSIIWGTTYLVLRMGVLEFPPFLFTAIRQVIAGVLLLTLLLILRTPLQLSGRYILHQSVAGFLLITLGNGLVAWSEVHIPSGVAAVLCSSLPVAVILINLVIFRERPGGIIIAGTLLGLAGMLLMFSEHLTELGLLEYRLGIVLTLVAVLSWATGSIWLKNKHQQSNPFVNAALQMLAGGLFCLLLSPLVDSWEKVTWTHTTFFALAYLILFGSLLAYASYLYALRKLPVSVVSLYAYINPVVAVVLGWLVLDEKLNLRIVLSIAIVLAGIFLVNRGHYFFRATEKKSS